MSAETRQKYTKLLIKAEAARAVCDYEDYRALKFAAKKLLEEQV